jgi:hypothetical protein
VYVLQDSCSEAQDTGERTTQTVPVSTELRSPQVITRNCTDWKCAYMQAARTASLHTDHDTIPRTRAHTEQKPSLISAFLRAATLACPQTSPLSQFARTLPCSILVRPCSYSILTYSTPLHMADPLSPSPYDSRRAFPPGLRGESVRSTTTHAQRASPARKRKEH